MDNTNRLERISVAPYREMDPAPSMAEQMRIETDRALLGEFLQRVDSLLQAIGHRARNGKSEISWPLGGYTSKYCCEELAEALDEKGFTCVIRSSCKRWWRDPPADEDVWEVVVSW